MNKARRARISKLMEKVAELQYEVEEILEEEQEAYDNMPESLQDSERGEMMYEAIDNLESAVSSVEELYDYLETAAE